MSRSAERELYDSNILIDALKGFEPAVSEIDQSLSPAISIMSWMEVMAGASAAEEAKARHLLNRFDRLAITDDVMERSAVLRRKMRLKLPDAIILATAQVSGRVLVTRNTRDFGEGGGGVRVPYRV